jgi:hypothetical protein
MILILMDTTIGSFLDIEIQKLDQEYLILSTLLKKHKTTKKGWEFLYFQEKNILYKILVGKKEETRSALGKQTLKECFITNKTIFI